MERRIRMIKASERLKKYKISIVIFIVIMILCTIIPFVIKPTSKMSTIEEEKLYKKVEQYLIKLEQENHYKERLEFAINGDNFKTFIDIAQLGIEQNEQETYVYVWALIKSYYAQEEIVSTGSSMPYKFTIRNDEIVNYQIPEDGNMYAKSIEEIFPKKVREKLKKGEELVNEEKLEKQAQEYYKSSDITDVSYNTINASVESDNIYGSKFIGNWTPYKAEQKGKEISLREVYGSGISYGGELVLNEDGTYTEFIGVYSEDNIDDLQGTYKVDQNSETAVLLSNSGKTEILECLEYTNVNINDIIIRLSLEDDIYVYFTR